MVGGGVRIELGLVVRRSLHFDQLPDCHCGIAGSRERKTHSQSLVLTT